tara:strand:- start:34031 stop:34630 length:600 start_codon:yes stop_codon:yes gene_type:complete
MAQSFYELNSQPNTNNTRTPGVLLRRVSLLHTEQRPNIASISNNYGNPLHGNATIPDGAYCNYTPVSDDSLIKLSVSLFCYRGNSVSSLNSELHFNFVWQIGADFTGRGDYYGSVDSYITLKTEVPSWGEGQTRKVALRMTNSNGNGYYRTNINYNQTSSPSQRGILNTSRPKMVIEEFSPTEPLSPSIEVWEHDKLDF